jgi:long-chain fatty acid transport protein
VTVLHGKRLLILFVPLLLVGPVLAQDVSGLAGPPTFQFSFSNPGARSMGFGGAFVALADDATAAFANPAGLVQITRPEVALEGRYWDYSTPFVERGRFEGEPTGIGIDVVAGMEGSSSSYDTMGVSFVSFVYPKNRWSVAFYSHLLADFQSLTQTQGVFYGSGSDCCRAIDQRVQTTLDFVTYGFSGAYRVGDSLSLGLSLVYFEGNLDIVGQPFLPDPVEAGEADIFAPTSYLPARRVVDTILRVDDTDWGSTAGLLWWISPEWRLGGFYRQGPGFTMSGEVVAGPAGSFLGFPPTGTIIDSATTPIGFPDVYGLGFSFQPQDGRLTIAFEWDRVEYSTILDSIDQEVIGTSEISLEDGEELHLGAEYVFLRSSTLAAARLGVWLDPNHRPHFTRNGDQLEQALFPPGDDQIHYALGLGLAFKRFQIDLGADFSDQVDTLSVSAIYSF